MERTLEEAIEEYREKAEYFKRTTNVDYGLKLEQLAGWLEELSRHRVEELFRKNNGYTKEDIELNRNAAYNMAIDDLSIAFISEIKNDSVIPIFVRECETKFTATEVINIFSRTAKQLKECGSND